MKKIQLGIILLVLILVFPASTKAGVDVNINISLPPLFMLEAPPVVIAMPDTNNVYVVPDIDVDIFFWNGWWWMPWEGHWYRSAYYNRGWAYYNNIPSFYFDVDPGWRGYYRDHNWHGHRWDYERIPNQRLQQNWKSWQNSRRWERQGTWGVQNYQPRPQQQRQELRQQYQQRSEVQRQRQQQQEPQKRVQQPQRKPQVQQPRQQPQERVSRSKDKSKKPRVSSQNNNLRKKFSNQDNNLRRELSSHNNLNLDREDLKEENKKNPIEGRMTKVCSFNWIVNAAYVRSVFDALLARYKKCEYKE